MLPSDYLRQGWCQRMLAKDKLGKEVEPSSEHTVSWSLAGAAYKALSYDTASLRLFFAKLYPKLSEFVAVWNDVPGRTQAEVVALAEKVEREIGLRSEE